MPTAPEPGVASGFPFFVRPLRRFPPLWLFPGTSPAQLAACAASGNADISGPISAMMVHSVISLSPGIVIQRSIAPACGFIRSASSCSKREIFSSMRRRSSISSRSRYR